LTPATPRPFARFLPWPFTVRELWTRSVDHVIVRPRSGRWRRDAASSLVIASSGPRTRQQLVACATWGCGTLLNQISSIAASNPVYSQSVARGLRYSLLSAYSRMLQNGDSQSW